MADHRVASTQELEALVAEGRKKGFNRQLDLSKVQVDPDGWHIVTSFMVHGTDFDPRGQHLRCRVMVKLVDTMEPAEAWIDVTFKAFNALRIPSAIHPN